MNSVYHEFCVGTSNICCHHEFGFTLEPIINQHVSLPQHTPGLWRHQHKNMQKPEEVSRPVFSDEVSWVICLVASNKNMFK